MYDRKAVFFRHENKYHIRKDEVEYIVIADHAKINAILVNAGHMKRLIDSNKGCMLMVVREKATETSEAFQGLIPLIKRNCTKLFLTRWDFSGTKWVASKA